MRLNCGMIPLGQQGLQRRFRVTKNNKFISFSSKGSVGAREWEVFRHADDVCLCHVSVLNVASCITCILLVLVVDARVNLITAL